MTRRGLLGSLLGVVTAPFVAAKVKLAPAVVKVPRYLLASRYQNQALSILAKNMTFDLSSEFGIADVIRHETGRTVQWYRPVTSEKVAE